MAIAPSAPARVHGSLVEVAGVGVLLLGRSGIGKSECALELVMRGHRLVADDVVMIGADLDGAPIGASPELVRHYIELRGIGIVHVPSLFGAESVADRARIELVVRLESWGVGEVERVGLERRSEDVAGFAVEVLNLPVAPGRNIASLVEVGARNHLLKNRGKSGAEELDARVFALLRGEGS
jgi:HPr kinase/phosphorylase